MLEIWDLAAITAKVFQYLGVFVAAGIVFSALLFRLQNTNYLAISFAVVGIAGTLLAFFIGGPLLTGELSGMWDVEILGVLSSTSVGSTTAYRLVGLGGLIIGLMLTRFSLWCAGIGGIIAVWSFSQIGHIHDRNSFLLHVAINIHLFVVALWIGILIPLRRLSLQSESLSEAARVSHQFGQLATFLVPVLILVGVVMGYVLIGNITSLIFTGYGQMIIVKTVLVVTLLGLAALNKYRYVPQLKQMNIYAGERLARSITAEMAVVVGVLIATAVVTTILTPP